MVQGGARGVGTVRLLLTRTPDVHRLVHRVMRWVKSLRPSGPVASTEADGQVVRAILRTLGALESGNAWPLSRVHGNSRRF